MQLRWHEREQRGAKENGSRIRTSPEVRPT